jgi:hypothetical protein
MANVTQLYTILNAVAAQSMGSAAIAVVDTRSMVALGDAVLSSNSDVDKFVGALVDRIGRTIVSAREWTDPAADPLVKKPFEYGTILQKLYVDIEDAAPNNAWEIGDVGYSPSWAPVYKPDCRAKLFNKISTWEFNFTIPDNLLRTGFTNETEMSAFITAIYVAMDNSMALAIRNANNLTRNTAMAITVNNGGINAINLLTEYNTAFPNATITAAEALLSPDFLRYAAKRMIDVTRYMRDLVRSWNNEQFARHTPNDLLNITMLQAFDSAETVYLQSDTFHADLVKLGSRYNTVSFWQGAGTSGYAFADISAIKIKITDPSDSTKTIDVEQSGILAVMHDLEAMGTTINNRRVTTERNNKDEYTDTFSKANIGYFYDGSENICVFYVADPVTP